MIFYDKKNELNPLKYVKFQVIVNNITNNKSNVPIKLLKRNERTWLKKN